MGNMGLMGIKKESAKFSRSNAKAKQASDNEAEDAEA